MNTINLALQIVPSGLPKGTAYRIVDEAIKAIAASGLKYLVSPFETVIEGPYDKVMETVEAAQEAAFKAGAEDMLVYIKIQRSKTKNVAIDDKIAKYH